MPASQPESDWSEAMATVTACKYEFGAGRALAFGAPTSKHFRITYNYWAPNAKGEDELHTGEFSSEKGIPQNTLFPITYNPKAPHDHARFSHASPTAPTRNPVIAVGIIGSVVLSTIWLILLRSCR